MNKSIKDILKDMKKDIKTDLVVIYHENCMDGYGVLIAVLENLDVMPSPTVIPIPATYGKVNIDKLLKDVEGKNVIMGDFSLDTSDMLLIKHSAKEFVALDHHKTAIDRFKPLNFAEVDMRESGATLVWKYFTDKPVPLLLAYIKDRDLWQHKLPNTREINAGAKDVADKKPETLLLHLYNVDSLQEIGTDIVTKIDNRVRKVLAMNNTRPFLANGVSGIYIKNRDEISLVGNELSIGKQYSAQVFLTDDKLVVSLRSDAKSKNSADVSDICKTYGGGGHVNAAAMSFKYEDIDINTLFRTGDLDKALANTIIKKIMRLYKEIR